MLKKILLVLLGYRRSNKVSSAIDTDQIDNKKQLVSYAAVPQISGMPNLNWDVVLAEDTATVYTGEGQLLLNLFLGTGLTALIASVTCGTIC